MNADTIIRPYRIGIRPDTRVGLLLQHIDRVPSHRGSLPARVDAPRHLGPLGLSARLSLRDTEMLDARRPAPRRLRAVLRGCLLTGKGGRFLGGGVRNVGHLAHRLTPLCPSIVLLDERVDRFPDERSLRRNQIDATASVARPDVVSPQPKWPILQSRRRPSSQACPRPLGTEIRNEHRRPFGGLERDRRKGSAPSAGAPRAEKCGGRLCEPSCLFTSVVDCRKSCPAGSNRAVLLGCIAAVSASSAVATPIATRSAGWMKPSARPTPPVRRIASRSGTAQWCSSRTAPRRNRWDLLEDVPRVLVAEHVDAASAPASAPISAPVSKSSPSIRDRSAPPACCRTRSPPPCSGCEVHHLHLTCSILMDGERVDHPHRVALAELLELRDDLAVEVRLVEPATRAAEQAQLP